MITGLTVFLQSLNLVGFVVILLGCGAAWRRWPDARGLLVAPALWAAYGAVYYTFIFTGRLSGPALLLWGAIHRMLVIYMILGGLVALWAILATPEPTLGDMEDEGGDDADE